ncbi:MAG: InlB B-repeat-containing protein [Lachnospiraceae bacterium]|nr:InlB B-repeat-containing protein [Lachnospiraceae bacterium]
MKNRLLSIIIAGALIFGGAAQSAAAAELVSGEMTAAGEVTMQVAGEAAMEGANAAAAEAADEAATEGANAVAAETANETATEELSMPATSEATTGTTSETAAEAANEPDAAIVTGFKETEEPEENLAQTEICDDGGFIEQRGEYGNTVLIQKLSDDSMFFHEVEEQADDGRTDSKATAEEKAFWESLDYDAAHAGALTGDQKKFYERMDTVLNQYLYDGAAAVAGGSGENTMYYTSKIEFGDLSSLSFPSAQDPGNANNVIYLAESFLFCHPQFFFVTTSFSGTDSYLRLAILPDFTDPAKRAAAGKEIMDNIAATMGSANDSSEASARQVHDALCARISYDTPASQAPAGQYSEWVAGNRMYEQSMASVFIGSYKKTVCAGYSQALCAMCNRAAISSFSITSSSHQWNKVKLGSYWYCVDATWDDGASVSHDYYLKSDSSPQFTNSSHTEMAYWSKLLEAGEYALYDYGEEKEPVPIVTDPKLTLNYSLSKGGVFSDGTSSRTDTLDCGETYMMPGSNGDFGPAPKRPGYKLSKWTAADGTSYALNKLYTNIYTEDKTLSFEPVWNARKYALSYSLDNGKKASGTPSSFTLTGNPYIPAPERKGSTFAGWLYPGNTDSPKLSLTAEDFAAMVTDATVDEKGKVTLKAVWTPDSTYTVNFLTNDGTGIYDEPVVYGINASVELPVLTENGMQFAGWAKKADATAAKYKQSSSTGKFTAKNITDAGKTVDLYAVWKDSWAYQVQFDPNGGVFADDAVTSIACAGKMYYEAPVPEREGYNFAGYALTSYASGAKFKVNTKTGKVMIRNASTYSADVTLYAVWKAKSYSVSYAMNGGKRGKGSVTKFKSTDNAVTVTAPTKKGASFAGWYLNGTLLEDGNADISLKVSKLLADGVLTGKSSIRLVAAWKPITYLVTFNACGGMIDSEPIVTMEFKYGVPYQAFTGAEVARDGYRFRGWAKKQNGPLDYKGGAKLKNLSSKEGGEVTLYAKWKAEN